MPVFSRRELLASGIALSASPLLARASWAKKNALPDTHDFDVTKKAFAAIAPREELLMDFGWKFRFGHGTDPSKDLDFGFGLADFTKTGEFKFAKAEYDDSAWRSVNLPHDWAVELPFVHDDSGTGDNPLRGHGYKPLGRRYPETSVGWYRREFEIPAGDLGRQIWVEFDGAFREVLVFVNGCLVGRHEDGYTHFRFDLTDFLAYGTKNYIVARVDASQGEGWFYEGAGIYRHVWMLKIDPVHLGRWESVVRSSVEGDVATLALSTIVENRTRQAKSALVKWKIVDAHGVTIATTESSDQPIEDGGSARFNATARISHPALWSVDTPHLYTAVVTVESEGSLVDGERVVFGVRSVVFDAEKGFFLNGDSMKIQGTCNHQDHAGVGVALPDRLQSFRLSVLREMGCNAVRTSHNMPTPEWVEACDRMGMMMMCETRQANSSDEGLRQLEWMVKRYRNSPSIILWSIGNEETQLQKPMAEQGAHIAESMVYLCHKLDSTRKVTIAVNSDNEQGVSDAVDVVGFNYHTREFPEVFHKNFPLRPIVGSEVSSAVSTRGEYITDGSRNIVNSYDGDSIGNETPEVWWQFYGIRGWEEGGFAWTGFDYRGEPYPYGWPSVNSQFGIVDICGFPKDYFYYYKSWWGKAPALHLFPHWNWPGKEGSEIPVWVYSNLDEIELFLNGASLGVKKVPRLGHLEWKVRYQPGVIEARGSKGGKILLVERQETTEDPESIRLTADRSEINADGEDIAILKVEVLDRQRRPVPTANNKIAFKVTGHGVLIGVGNGDPNCQESDKEPRRSLFNGLAQVILQGTQEPGTIWIEAVKDGSAGPELMPARMTIPTRRVPLRAAVPTARKT